MTDRKDRIHNQIAELLSAYIDDQVTADERRMVETHLATCAACAQDLATLRQTISLLGELPQVAAPRPFTLRESDVRPVPGPARPAWWRLPWAQGLVGAAAMLLCVVVVGVVLLGRGGMVGAPAAPERLAMEALPTTQAANEKAVVVEAEKEVLEAAEPAAAPPLPEATTAEFGMAQEVPAEAAPPAGAAPVEEKAAPEEGKAAADEADVPLATAPARVASGAAPTPSATPAPMPTTAPAPAAEALPATPFPTPTPTLLEVQDLNLEIKPGVVRARGRVSLPQGRKLLVVLWRDGQPIEWATLESRQLVVEADGQFLLVLIAQTEIPNFDLFTAEPASYEIRIRPVDPPAPVEIRIPFDTYGPPPPPSTNTP